MNLTNLTLQPIGKPLSNITNEIPLECMIRENAYSLDCIYKTICPQFNKYFIRIGLIIIIGYIIIMFLKWWFFKYGYLIFKITSLNDIDKRIYWDTFINSRLAKIMLGYITIVVYLSLREY